MRILGTQIGEGYMGEKWKKILCSLILPFEPAM
jgi:hypothetical protein